MPELSLTLRDLAWFASLLVTVALAYGRLKGDIRHLEDTKANRQELVRISEELREMLTDIRTSLARLEETIRKSGQPHNDSQG